MLQKYAHLLVNYSLSIRPGERLLIKSTTLAEPLLREVYREAIRSGAHVEVSMDFAEKNRIFLNEASDEQLGWISPLTKTAMESFEAFLVIRAPFNLREDQNIKAGRQALVNEAAKGIQDIYARRTATRELKRSLCQYPTQASAQEAGMSLEEYSDFVFKACKLDQADPIQAWLQVRADQQRIVDHLNACKEVHYQGPDIDIRFSTAGRSWINSDGQTNMPSGEVYTSPVEDSVQGRIRFSFPSLYGGHEVKGVTLQVKDGWIESWEAESGQDYLDSIFKIEGARRFGEAAIGTNYGINRMTKNILFDEKIGGTIHMAIGQSYLQTGGMNHSSIHWDMITDMRTGGRILADKQMIYENGQFLI